MTRNFTLISIALLIAFSTQFCNAQDIHPYKQKFADFNTWTVTKPGDITFTNFTPYRAVYNREYTNSQGESRTDKVIMTAQRTWWYGKPAILFEYHDGGSSDFDDTNGRSQVYYLDEETLTLKLAVGPKTGTPEDYTNVRIFEDRITTSWINTETGEADYKEFKTTDPVFPFNQLRFLIWSAMDLEAGKKIKLEGIFHTAANQTIPDLGWVLEQREYSTPDGTKYNPFVIENTSNPSSAILNQYFVIDEAPYVLAQGLYNADDDEIYRWFLELESFEYLGTY